MNAQIQESHTVSIKFQLIFICITVVAVCMCINRNLGRFQTMEPPVMSKEETHYAQSIDARDTITSGIFLRDIADLNISSGTFTANILVWFSFDPRYVDQDLVGKFTVERAEERFRSEPIVQKNNDGTIFVKYNLRLRCSTSFNYVDFPVDDHRIDFIITNYYLDASKNFYATSDKMITVSPDISIEGWHLVGSTAQAGYLSNILNPENQEHVINNPRVIFGFDVEREGIREILSTILPLLIIFFTALFTFTINPVGSDFYNVLSLSIASIMALIAYRFVIETASPHTGYFMLVDYIYLYFLIAMLGILFMNALGEIATSRTKKIAVVCLHMATIIVFVIVFNVIS